MTLIIKNDPTIRNLQQAIREENQEAVDKYTQEMRRGVMKTLEKLGVVQQSNTQRFHELTEQVQEEPRIVSKAELRRKSIELYRDADRTLLMARQLKKLIREAI